MKLSPHHLLLTTQGEAWLQFFDEPDKPLIRELTGALSLVSLTEFERSLAKLVLEVAAESRTVAIYSAREFEECLNFDGEDDDCESGLDATPRGSDIGSEGRTAHIARQIRRSASTKFMVHPSISQLRAGTVDHIVVIDDILGTGNRCSAYLDQLWKYATIKSWWSYKLIRFSVVAYAGTEDAIRLVRRHRCRPQVHVHRHCPTISSLPWPPQRRTAARAVCRKYADRWRIRHPLGYKKTASLLVFEHGCPNNVPSIFWGQAVRGPENWRAIFEGRSTAGGTSKAFPPEFKASTPVSALISAGQHRLAAALPSVVERPLSARMLLVLSLVWKGRRRLETLAHATGLTVDDCNELLESCIAAGFITPLRRITAVGLAEVQGAMKARGPRLNPVPPAGDDVYYPLALRSRISG
jgi:hypothetical protein